MTTNIADPVALLLAAGRSERMGDDKLLLPLDGKPMIERSLRSFRKAERVQDVIIVATEELAPKIEHLRRPNIHIVTNPEPERGMISSIRAGLESTWTHERNFLICPADMPFIKVEIVDQIVNAFITRGAKIVLPAYKGLGGHPGMYASTLRDDFFLHGDNNGAREILFRYREDTVRINVPDSDVCFDIDTMEHFQIATDAGARWARVDEMAEKKRLGALGK